MQEPGWTRKGSDFILPESVTVMVSSPVADPGFPRLGRQLQVGGCTNILFFAFFPVNCIKLEKCGPGGGAVPSPPLDPSMLTPDTMVTCSHWWRRLFSNRDPTATH